MKIIIENTNQSVIEFIRSGNILLACLEATDTTIYKSEDFGLTWSSTNSANLGYSNLSSLEILNNRIFYITYSAMFQSSDQGNNWERIGPFTWYPSELKSYGDYLFIGSLIPEMYKIHKDSTSISTLPGGSPPFQFVFAMDINAGLIVAAGQDINTSEYQIWTRTINDITSIENTEFSPDGFSLQQNYPNPFNPTTNIQFAIPQSSFVRLEVFNALGESVGVLISEELNTGIYNYSWNSSGYASGIYIYRITAGNFIETQKMMLLK